MNRSERSHDHQRSILSNGAVVLLFLLLMSSAIYYFYDAEPDIKRSALAIAAKELTDSVTNAHWQWQAEGRPEIIMMIHYDISGEEKDRRAIRINKYGRPAFEKSSQGCGQMWQKVLNIKLEISGFKVIPEYYSAKSLGGAEKEPICRFKLSTGPYFDYYTLSGRTTEIKN